MCVLGEELTTRGNCGTSIISHPIDQIDLIAKSVNQIKISAKEIEFFVKYAKSKYINIVTVAWIRAVSREINMITRETMREKTCSYSLTNTNKIKCLKCNFDSHHWL